MHIKLILLIMTILLIEKQYQSAITMFTLTKNYMLLHYEILNRFLFNMLHTYFFLFGYCIRISIHICHIQLTLSISLLFLNGRDMNIHTH